MLLFNHIAAAPILKTVVLQGFGVFSYHNKALYFLFFWLMDFLEQGRGLLDATKQGRGFATTRKHGGKIAITPRVLKLCFCNMVAITRNYWK